MSNHIHEEDLIFAHYVKHCNPVGEPNLYHAKSRLIGRFDSEYDFGKQYWQGRGWLDNLPEREIGYIDFRSWVDHAVNSGNFVIGDAFMGVDADVWVWKPSL